MITDDRIKQLIWRGKKPQALTDLIALIESQGCVTTLILDHAIPDLQDKAIRNFLVKLERINYVEVQNYKIPGDRWVQLFSLKGATYQLHDVIRRHKAARRRKRVHQLAAAATVLVNDLPFEVRFDNEQEYILANDALDVKVRFYSIDTPLNDAVRHMRQHLRRAAHRYPKLERYLKEKKKE